MQNEQTPLVSVITPAYNAERFIGETIQSVIDQTFTDWEMVIVDDRSQDRTVEIVEEYRRKDPRIRLVVLEENSGSAVARNTAIREAGGRYLAFLDSDDLWLPEKLERQLKFMQETGVAFSFTKYRRMLEDGTETNATTEAPATVHYDALMKRCVIGCLTVMLDTKRTGSVEMVNIRTRQDYALWLDLTRRGFLAYGIPEVLSKYRVVDNSISSNKWKAAKQNWRVFREVEKQSFPKSIWYFVHYAILSIRDVIKYRISQ
ncbi:glycosyltransferase family 2 protein [Thalassobacillus devorans]|uniref:glycosyltransferase family 2 protein n=1 Tax=Thalassobacillus devorans TaxID=279813 RepID=UPI000A1CE227|nr:glycosyltransferase family 2 protein [Thalassobacillus devorans]